MTTTQVLWERWPRETDRDWILFLAYREDAYPDGDDSTTIRVRSFRRVADACGVSEVEVRDIAEQRSWTQRAGAYDRHIDRRLTEARLSHSEAIARRQAYRLDRISDLLGSMLDHLTVQVDQGLCIDIKAFAKLAADLFRAERLVLDQSTSNVSQSGWTADALRDVCTPEELEILVAIQDRIAKKGA